MMHPQSSARGMATMSAIMLMAVVGTAVTTMSWHFHADVTRTKALRAQAQVQQLLHAATAHAMALAASAPLTEPAGPAAMPLPASLATAQAFANVTMAQQGDELMLRIQARVGSHASEQMLSFIQQDGRWQLKGMTTARPKKNPASGDAGL